MTARGDVNCSLDVVCCSTDGRRLLILARATGRLGAAELPWEALDPATALEAAARRIARAAAGRAPSMMSQIGACADRRRHPSGAPMTVAFLAIVPAGTPAPAGMQWLPADGELPFGARQRQLVADAPAALRVQMDIAPVAFRLLPEEFTLSQLQAVYELLLGRPLHKASFRRALTRAALAEATDAWRAEGRGRPARLYRYAPRPQSAARRSVRFELQGE